MYRVPAGSKVLYPSGTQLTRSEAFIVEMPEADSYPRTSTIQIPVKAYELIKGSAWGTFTIACTIPIALFVGWYMYRFRKGRVAEASLLGAAAVLFATVAGSWVQGSWLEPYFTDHLGNMPLRIHRIGLAGLVATVPS
jgi:carbon starvation protein